MTVKFNITENVSEYLDMLDNQLDKDMEYILNHLADTVTGKDEDTSAPIPSQMSTRFNPYLYTSGQMSKNRFVNQTPEKSTIEILYTGMDLEEDLGDEALVWWEFSEDHRVDLPPQKRTLERDYAFYQETGIDPIADEYDAKFKGGIAKGLLGSGYLIKRETRRQLDILLSRI